MSGPDRGHQDIHYILLTRIQLDHLSPEQVPAINHVTFSKLDQYNVTLDTKGCICHFEKWQIHPFISKVTINMYYCWIKEPSVGYVDDITNNIIDKNNNRHMECSFKSTMQLLVKSQAGQIQAFTQ